METITAHTFQKKTQQMAGKGEGSPKLTPISDATTVKVVEPQGTRKVGPEQKKKTSNSVKRAN